MLDWRTLRQLRRVSSWISYRRFSGIWIDEYYVQAFAVMFARDMYIDVSAKLAAIALVKIGPSWKMCTSTVRGLCSKHLISRKLKVIYQSWCCSRMSCKIIWMNRFLWCLDLQEVGHWIYHCGVIMRGTFLKYGCSRANDGRTRHGV